MEATEGKGVLEYWSIGGLEYWRIGGLEDWILRKALGVNMVGSVRESAKRGKHRTKATEGDFGVGELSYSVTPELLQLLNSC
jgi:hypothetical protein